ncbi:MAG: hypothetical protein J1D87_06975 [Lachnospiraceae bacterium]|nr:hypothetical protein [Lachnospiraceae bacterium]
MKKKNEDAAKVKKPFYKKWWFWVIIVVVILAIGANSGSNDENKDNPQITEQSGTDEDNKPTDESEQTEADEGNESADESEQSGTSGDNELTDESEQAETDDTQADIKKAIEDVVGVDNLESFNYVPSNNFSLIKFRGSENLTNKMTVEGMYLDMFNILKKIQPIIDTDVDFNIVYPLVDKYGNSEDVIVIKATFKNETIQKINFDNALFENIADMADEWWNHDAVNISD